MLRTLSTLPTPSERFPRTLKVLEEGAGRSLHRGVQVSISLNGELLADFGWGEARPGAPLTPQTRMLWLSSGKPLTVVALARLQEQGELRWEAPLTELLPDLPAERWEGVTVTHLLTHTSGMELIDSGWPANHWDDILKRIARGALPESANPGTVAAYQPSLSWFLLGEIIARRTGEPFPAALRKLVLEPLGMDQTFNGIAPEQLDAAQEELVVVEQRSGGRLVPIERHLPPAINSPSPGGNTWGPVSDLRRFYEMLLARGRTETGDQLLREETVQLLTSRHRTGQLDQTFQHVIDYGLGLIIDSSQYGAETVPYGFGLHCSPQTFGHGGAQSSIGFADPACGLAVAWAASGMAGEGWHQKRNRALNTAIYEDLGLAR
ncbi:MAG: beta-lactamase family protein [Planctomycetaceae bacterium]|nr:beta-lactamase family protein [Planctomycetaceae bacterium]